MYETVNIIGAGLAGSEAALYLAKHGYRINLYDMKPTKKSNAHHSDCYCELVCNNSFCSSNRLKPLNLLFNELKTLDSELVKYIERTQIDDSNCIAVDKREFSKLVTKAIQTNDNINVINTEVTKIIEARPTILATGPLTSNAFLEHIKSYFKNMVSIADANSIVVDLNSIDKNKIVTKSDDVFEVHLSESEYFDLEDRLKTAGTVIPHNDEDDFRVLQCLPVEVLATRKGNLAKTKLRPTEKSAFATLVLRRDDRLTNSAVLSEFTTRMKFSEQKRILHTIRGLEKAEIIRYGQLHYNTFINAPYFLNNNYEVENDPGLYVIGQLSGVDGYLPAISSAIVAAIALIRKSRNLPKINFPSNTITGGLANYVSTQTSNSFKPIVPLFELLSNPIKSPDEIIETSITTLKNNQFI